MLRSSYPLTKDVMHYMLNSLVKDACYFLKPCSFKKDVNTAAKKLTAIQKYPMLTALLFKMLNSYGPSS